MSDIERRVLSVWEDGHCRTHSEEGAVAVDLDAVFIAGGSLDHVLAFERFKLLVVTDPGGVVPK